MRLRATDILRYGLWLGVLGTANANRKQFGLPTTWVIHASLNTVILLLPELYGGAAAVLQLDARAREKHDLLSTAHGVVEDAVVNNPHYAIYVAPVALAYMVSHPQFNIYKGDYAKIRVLGFGLDAIPHSTTAFGFSNLLMDALAAFRRHTPRRAPYRGLAEWGDDHAALVAGSLLVGASAFYEAGEYAIHKEELRETGGDETKINMEWSAQDTLFDLLSNTLGWLAAVALRRTPRRFARLAVPSREQRA